MNVATPPFFFFFFLRTVPSTLGRPGRLVMKGLTSVGVVRAAGVVQPDGAMAVSVGGAPLSVVLMAHRLVRTPDEGRGLWS